MRDIKNKFLMPYMIIEFVLFLTSFFLSMTSELIKANIDIFVLISCFFTIIFSIFMIPRINKDRLYAIIFSSLFFLGELFYGLLKYTGLGTAVFILALGSFAVRLIFENGTNKTFYLILLGLILLSSLILSFFLYIGAIIGITALTIISILMLVFIYKKGIVLHRVNWFLGGMGIMVFDLFMISITLDSMVPDSAMVKTMLGFASKAFLIPSAFLMIISYTLFEQKDGR